MSKTKPHSTPTDKSLPPQKVTQKTVAAAANVSQSLVSMVLNGDGTEASEEIRQRILQTAKDLNYTPLRRRSDKGKRKLFAMIRPVVQRGHHKENWIYDSYEQFYLDLQEQVRLVLQAKGYNLISHDDSDPESVMQWLRKWDVQGVFANSTNSALMKQIQEEFAVIEMTRDYHREIDCVTSDDYERVAIAFDYLYDKGHRRIGYLCSLEQAARSLYHFSYRECCRKKGVRDELIDVSRFHPDILRYAKRFAASPDRPTAIIADPIRLLILQKHFVNLGISVPQDVSLLSLDNISACRFMEPALVAIDLNFPALAEHALNTLLLRINDSGMARCKIEILPHLVPGSSVASPSAIQQTNQLQPTS